MTDENLSAEWRKVLEGWSDVQIEILAQQFYESCNGDARRLLCSVDEENGIYGSLAMRVLKVNNFFARTSLRSFWLDNKRDIKKHYAMLKYPSAKTAPKLTDGFHVGTPLKKFCWCETRIDGFSVMCDVCNNWFHVICCGITEAQAIGMGEFVCLVCTGSPKVPRIWIESHRSDDLEISGRQDLDRTEPDKYNADCRKTPLLMKCHAPRDLTSEMLSENIKETEIFTPPLRRTIPARAHPENIVPPGGQEQQSEIGGNKNSSEGSQDVQDKLPTERHTLDALACKRKHDADELLKKRPKKQNTKCVSSTDVVDARGIPMDFILTITRDDWNKIVCRNVAEDGRIFYEATSNYASILTPYFNKLNHICVIVGEKKILTHPFSSGSSAAFYIARTKCKAQECKAKYAFTVQRRPKKKLQEINVYVKRSGTIHHLHGIKVSRPLKGDEREEAKGALQLKRPGIYRREKFGVADTKQLQAWNYNMVKELKVYQQANFEKKSDDDFHQDPIVDTVITSFHQKYHSSQKKLPGFIQSVSVDPFFVVMFCEDQLRFLQSLTKARNVVLFLDATGTLAQRLPKPYPQTSVYYYALVAKPAPTESAVPLLEFYSASHDASSIETCLRTFFSSYKKYCSVRGKGCGIVRIEIDFSKALMAAVANVFQHGDVEEYIHHLWMCLAFPDSNYRSFFKKPLVAIHICRIHVNRFWGRKIDRTFTKKRAVETVREFYKDWMVKFIRTKSIQSIQRRMFDALIISGSLYLTQDVNRRLREFDNRTNYDDYEQLIDFEEIDRSSEEPFYRRSMFGRISTVIKERVTTLNVESIRAIQLGAKLEKNQFYSMDIFDYLLVHVLPYAPILNQSVFQVFNQPVGDDTTNNVENWIGLLKRDFFKGEKKMRMGRLARAHEKLISGSIIQAIAAINGLADELPEKHTDEEEEMYEGIHPLVPEEIVDLEEQSEEDVTRGPAKTEEFVPSTHVRHHSKISLSPELSSEVWGTKKSKANRKPQHCVVAMPVIPTGAMYSKNGQTFTITNTCNIDTTLQVLYYLYTYTHCREFFDSAFQDDEFSCSLQAIISRVEKEQFDEARVEWIQSVLGIDLQSDYNVYGSESENGTSHVSAWTCSFQRHQICLNESCQKSKTSLTSFTEIKGLNSDDVLRKLNHGEVKEDWCSKCQSSCKITYDCNKLADLLVYTCDGMVTEGGVTRNYSTEKDLPMTQNIFGSLYEVLAYTCYTGNHFYSVVVADGNRYTVDGSRGAVKPRHAITEKDSVSSVWLYRKT